MVDLFYNAPASDMGYRNLKCANGFQAIIRSDTRDLLGVASDRYSPIQIRDQWKGLNPLIEAGLASIETMGSIEGGKRVWGLVKFNSEAIPEWDELQAELGEIQPYGLVMDDKTGKKAAIIAATNIRTVCKNTLEAGLTSMTQCVRIKHIGDTEQKMKDAAQDMWGTLLESYSKLSEKYRALNSRILSEVEYEKNVLDPIVKIPNNPLDFKTESRFEKAVERAKNKRRAVYNLWFNGLGHTGDHSAWEAYNGAVQAIDHNEGNIFNKTNNMIGSMLTGPRAQLKATISNNLIWRLAA